MQIFEEVRWGSIGCGDVMEVKSGPALQNVPHSTLQAVMRRNADLARDFAQRHHVPKWYDDAEALIKDPLVNAIYVATPPDTHLAYTLLAAQAGKPVYVEKPMANSHAECLGMIEACEAHGVPLFVAYYRRSLDAYLKVKSILDSGVLGRIQGIEVFLHQPAKPMDIQGQANWRVIPEIAGCGYFCDLGSHIFDLLQFLLGDIVEARGVSRNQGGYYQAEDGVKAEFRFQSGVSGRGSWDFNAEEDLDVTHIKGTQGSVSYSHFKYMPVTLNLGDTLQQFPLPHPRHIQQPLITRIVGELRGTDTSPSTGRSAAKTNWVLDQILNR